MNKLAFTLIISFLLSSILLGQGLFETQTAEKDSSYTKDNVLFNGYFKSSVYTLGQNYDFNTVRVETSFKLELNWSNTFAFAEAKLQTGWLFNNPFSKIFLREAYAGYKTEKLSFQAGNQIISWGRTDGFNPTNNITPKDYFNFSSDPDDQNISNFILSLKYSLNSIFHLELIGIPIYKNSQYPYDLFLEAENISFTEPSLPPIKFGNGAFALKIDAQFNNGALSFSLFRGYDPFCAYNINSIFWENGIPSISYEVLPYLKTSLGGDFEWQLNSLILRGEYALDITKDYKENMHIPNPNLSYVFSLEQSFGGWTCVLQYIGLYSFDYNYMVEPVVADPSDPALMQQFYQDLIIWESEKFTRKLFHQQEKVNHAFSINFNRSFYYEILELQLTSYYNFTSREYFLRPLMKYKASDLWQINLGWNYMNGENEALFTLAGPFQNSLFLEIKATF